MPPLPPPNTLAQLEEACRRLEEVSTKTTKQRYTRSSGKLLHISLSFGLLLSLVRICRLMSWVFKKVCGVINPSNNTHRLFPGIRHPASSKRRAT